HLGVAVLVQVVGPGVHIDEHAFGPDSGILLQAVSVWRVVTGDHQFGVGRVDDLDQLVASVDRPFQPGDVRRLGDRRAVVGRVRAVTVSVCRGGYCHDDDAGEHDRDQHTGGHPL